MTIVERALHQTHRAGHAYLAVPSEMLSDDPGAIRRFVAELPEQYCGVSSLDASTDVTHVCLRESLHDGPCGWPKPDAADDLRAEQFDRLLIRDVDAAPLD